MTLPLGEVALSRFLPLLSDDFEDESFLFSLFSCCEEEEESTGAESSLGEVEGETASGEVAP
jgi:hypothetical protein